MTTRRSEKTLTADEAARYATDGYLVRPAVLQPKEIEEICQVIEDVLDRLVKTKSGAPVVGVSGFYAFEPDHVNKLILKWEPKSPDVLMGVEPFAHLHPALQKLAADPRLTAPSASILGLPEVALFTEKLNAKRARTGGAYALHQDRPYWVGNAEDPDAKVTVLLALDAADKENGCLDVIPGSHLWETIPFKESDQPFERNEIDESQVDLAELISVEVPAGSLVVFGSRLVHRSGVNDSDRDRRAILYTYQPVGHTSAFEYFRNRL